MPGDLGPHCWNTLGRIAYSSCPNTLKGGAPRTREHSHLGRGRSRHRAQPDRGVLETQRPAPRLKIATHPNTVANSPTATETDNGITELGQPIAGRAGIISTGLIEDRPSFEFDSGTYEFETATAAK